jgi:hypothetical protein
VAGGVVAGGVAGGVVAGGGIANISNEFEDTIHI